MRNPAKCVSMHHIDDKAMPERPALTFSALQSIRSKKMIRLNIKGTQMHLKTRKNMWFCGTLLACLSISAPASSQEAGTAPQQKEMTYGEKADQEIQNFHWNAALQIYRDELARNENNADAWRGMGRILRWQGHLEESRQAYEKAAALEPDNSNAALGIASTYFLDHDFDRAAAGYAAARERWPDDEEVRQAADDFARERNPRVYGRYERDLTFRTITYGAGMPLLSREDIQLESVRDESLGQYIRKDKKATYTHFFALNNFLEFRYRRANYTYSTDVTDFSAIDWFDEYRLRYSYPFTPEQVGSVTYTYRPTKLKTTQQSYNSTKYEFELHSQWSPRFGTVVGGGQLRDLNGDPTTTSDLRNTSLVKAGVEYMLTQKAQATATYITNPDLDNSIHSKSLFLLSYQWRDNLSSLLRYRYDDYKSGGSQRIYSLAMRYTPDAHVWVELGVLSAARAGRSGVYPQATLIYKF
ncbi:tetratricopeptide repeat protein [Oxalobacteraceae bacterium CAVE-383]|nr:tetratricopeptide repeat protein [Oxalobacteraceae bacterium CAVE-383]